MTSRTTNWSRLARSLFSLAIVLIVAPVLLWPAHASARPPRQTLTRVSVSPASFYADSGSTTIAYTLNRMATVSVVVRDRPDHVVATIQPGTVQQIGPYSLTWDGTDDGGATLPAGSYSVAVTATNSYGLAQVVEPVEIVAPVLAEVGVSPAAFFVGSGSTSITYTLTGPATVSVIVTDAGGAAVRTLQADAAEESGPHTLTWDGTDDGGTPLPAGSYSVVVTATTAIGTVQVTKPVEIVVPVLTEVGVSPGSFFGGAGASGSTAFTYTLTGPATVSVIVTDAGGATVRTLQASTTQDSGSYALTWDGTDDGGATLPAGTYTFAIDATSGGGAEQSERTVDYTPTPVASGASLALNATGGHVLRAVVENWSETLNGQTPANYYHDGVPQPWEYAATSDAVITLYVGADPSAQEDTTAGGAVAGTSDASGVVDLVFPAGLDWFDESGAPLPLFYSVKLTYGGSSRWYPENGRYALRAPADADGHTRFVYMSDIQVPQPGLPTPDLQPNQLTDATGPYTAIPRLSRSLGWNVVLSRLLQETEPNLLVFGGDLIERGLDSVAPDDGNTQYRTVFDNEQTFGPADEWSLSSLAATLPVAQIAGNHEDFGRTSGAVTRWKRWVYTPGALPYYTFDQGDVHFVMLDAYYASTNPATNYVGWIGFQSDTAGGSRTVMVDGVEKTFTNSTQADWLIGAIDTDKAWTVVLTHYPLFDAYRTTSNAYNDGNTTGPITATNQYSHGERNRLLAFFAAHGVDVVLQGHNHNYRRHVEKVRSADGSVASRMTFITQAVAGGPPTAREGLRDIPYIDWLDLDVDGVPDANEPKANEGNNPYWDAAAFGQENSVIGASGYFGTPDMFHTTGQEYDDGIRFAYSVLETGVDDQGAPTLSLTVNSVSWNAAADTWNPWQVFETASIRQVDDGMVADRLLAP